MYVGVILQDLMHLCNCARFSVQLNTLDLSVTLHSLIEIIGSVLISYEL